MLFDYISPESIDKPRVVPLNTQNYFEFIDQMS